MTENATLNSPHLHRVRQSTYPQPSDGTKCCTHALPLVLIALFSLCRDPPVVVLDAETTTPHHPQDATDPSLGAFPIVSYSFRDSGSTQLVCWDRCEPANFPAAETTDHTDPFARRPSPRLPYCTSEKQLNREGRVTVAQLDERSP